MDKQELHKHSLKLAAQYNGLEPELLKVIYLNDKCKLYADHGYGSLYAYVTSEMKLTENIANAFIAIARKSKDVPKLISAIIEKRITPHVANRLVSSLTKDNAEELIAFAETHTTRELERKLQRKDQTTIKISYALLEKLKRIADIEDLKRDEVLEMLADNYLEKNDPVKKAERAATRPSKPCARRVNTKGRQPFNADQKHSVNRNHHGRCAHINHHGKRCPNERYLHVHHILPVSLGGTNDPENLMLLCSEHHRLVHKNVRMNIFTEQRY